MPDDQHSHHQTKRRGRKSSRAYGTRNFCSGTQHRGAGLLAAPALRAACQACELLPPL